MSPSIGERLKSARQDKGIDLDEACRATKTQRGVLEALEENRIEDLLEPVYAKIFIKKYASFLGLDGAALVEEYLTLRGGLPESELSVEMEAIRMQTLPSIQKVLIPAGVGLFALVGMVFLGNLAMDSYRSAASNSESNPQVGTPSARPVPQRPLVPLSRKLKLTIRTSDEVWLQVKSDGTVIFQNVLPKGSHETWIAKKELELWTGNAGAMELSLNGKTLRSLGRGVKKGIKVTHSGLHFSR